MATFEELAVGGEKKLPLSRPLPYTICYISSEALALFRIGVNFFSAPESGLKLLVLKSVVNGEFRYKACRNRCKHQNGVFELEDMEDMHVVKCKSHGWRLDVENMTYLGLADCITQDELQTKLVDGDLQISDVQNVHPWEISPAQSFVISENEFFVSYLSHSTVEINADGFTLVTDPWLSGPAFGDAWWLTQNPPANAFDRVSNCNALYISDRLRPDHCHAETLIKLQKLNPSIPIYVAQSKNFETSLWAYLTSLGFTKVTNVVTGDWVVVNQFTRFMLLPNNLPVDSHSDDDSFLLFEYKGMRVVYLINSTRPNCDHIPPTNLLITDYSIGAWAHPSCFGETLGETVARDVSRSDMEQYFRSIAGFISSSKATAWMPVGGHYSVAHPAYRDIRKYMVIPTMTTAKASMKSRFPELAIVEMNAGDSFDMSVKNLRVVAKPSRIDYEYFDFRPFRRPRLHIEPLQYLRGVQYYYTWANFPPADMILHMVECNEGSYDISNKICEYWVDLAINKVFITKPNLENVPHFTIRANSNTLRNVMYNGLPWDSLLSGLAVRITKSTLSLQLGDFWKHFRKGLPGPNHPPKWDDFNMSVTDVKLIPEKKSSYMIPILLFFLVLLLTACYTFFM